MRAVLRTAALVCLSCAGLGEPRWRPQAGPAAARAPQYPSGRARRRPATASSAPCRAAWPRSSRRRCSQWGLPNGYILGQEAGGAFVGGLRYGEGMLYTKNAGDLRVFWQGPSVGFDFGGEGARTMMLVYNLPATEAIYQRFVGIDGSAYFVGGFGMTALTANNIVVVPIRSGVGLRLGANIGYLKFTPRVDLEPVLSGGAACPAPQPPRSAVEPPSKTAKSRSRPI